MTLRGARDLSVPVLLALAGAALCVGSLFLHWATIDVEAIARWLETSPAFADARATSHMTEPQLHVAMHAQLSVFMEQFDGKLTGWRGLKVTSVIAQLVAAGYVVAAVARFTNRGGTRARLAVDLFGAGAVLAFRPIWTLVRKPHDALSELAGVHVFAVGPGVYVAMLGAALVLLSALLTQRAAATGIDAQEVADQEAAEYRARTGGGGITPAPEYVGLRAATTTATVPTEPYAPRPIVDQPAPPMPESPLPPQVDPTGSVAPPGFS